MNIKEYQQYNHTHNTGLYASGGTSILVRNDVHQSKINLTTTLQVTTVKVILHRPINTCSVYITPNE